MSLVVSKMNTEKPYLCDYVHNGVNWSFEIYASSFEDAEKRLKAIAHGNVLGVVKAKISMSWVDNVRSLVSLFL